MSRSGYSDDCDGWELIRWRGAVNSAITGRRGQEFLKELLLALDDMPDKRLITDELVTQGGFCTIGVVGNTRGVDMTRIDPHDRYQVGEAFGIAPALAAEIVFMNDEFYDRNTPEERYQLMRQWVVENINKEIELC